MGSALAWTLGAVASIGVGQLALAMIEDGLAVAPPMSVTADDAAGPSLTTPAPPPPPASTPTPTRRSKDPSAAPPRTRQPATPSATATSPPGARRLLTSPGGTAAAECSATGVYLISWSPAQGYLVGKVKRGPADSAHVYFQSGKHHVKLYLWCVGGVPQKVVEEWDDP